MLEEYLLAAAIVFGINLLPAFGPPTWSVLVVTQVNFELFPPALVIVGAFAAASGRVILALGSRRFRGRMSSERIEHLDTLASELTASRGRGLAGLGLFLISPLPSAQLFIAAGILDAPMRPLVAAFFGGRLIAYSLYVGIATVAADNVGEVISESLSSPIGIAVQLVMLAGLAALVKIDWARILIRAGNSVDPRP